MRWADLQAWERVVRSFIRERHAAMGDLGGLEPYYLRRLETGQALTDYERALLRLLARERRLFHAGIGIGALTAGLAREGVACVGFEFEWKRFGAALALREAAGRNRRYELRQAKFPEGLLAEDRTHGATLLFTNVASGWDEAQTARAIETMHRFRRTILDLRLLGRVRDDAADRAALRDQIVAAGHSVAPLAIADDAYYVEVRSTRGRPLGHHLRTAAGRVLDALPFEVRRRRR